MPLVNAKCTNCSATLQVDNTKDALVCPYCGSAFIVEKAIQNYNITNHITAQTVNIYGGNSADFVITAGKLVKYNGASTDVVIPNTVKIIGYHAFYRCQGLSNVTIPNSVTTIEQNAFEDCSGLLRLTIPNSVTTIGSHAFEGCSSLTSVTISSSISSIADFTFARCSSLRSLVIPSGVTAIGNQAFWGCTGLTSVTIPDSVANISDYIFHRNIPVVNASEAWKRKNWSKFDCLKSYAPATVAPKSVSASASKSSSSGCYIATCVYGSYDCPNVWTLRRFRDNTLDRTPFGRAFIKCYYAVSPTLVRLFGNTKWFRGFWKSVLDRFVARLNKNGVENTRYTDKY